MVVDNGLEINGGGIVNDIDGDGLAAFNLIQMQILP